MPHRHDQLLSRSKLYTSTLPKSSQVFEHILDHTDAEAIRWPEEAGHLSAEAVELVVELLHPLPDRRLGADGLATLRDHPFFGANGVDWALLQERRGLEQADMSGTRPRPVRDMSHRSGRGRCRSSPTSRRRRVEQPHSDEVDSGAHHIRTM